MYLVHPVVAARWNWLHRYRLIQLDGETMNLRAIGLSAAAGTIVMFAWQTISQTVIPWHAATMQEVADTTPKAIPAIRQLAKQNGVYYSRFGALMAVRVAPD